MSAALTREQKLLAEIVVQLGNITEAIQSADLQQHNADLQAELAKIAEGDITPDNINQVMSTLGIDFEQ